MDGPVFISYSRTDKARVEQLVNFLSENDIPVWWDEEMEAGQVFRNVIGNVLDKACCVVVAWSVDSVAKDFVRAEAEEGRKRGVLLPVILDKNLRIPLPFTEYHYADLSKPDFVSGKEIGKLLKTIRAIIESGRPVHAYEQVLSPNSWTLSNVIDSTNKVRDLVRKIGSLAEIMTLESKPTADIQKSLGEVEKTYEVVTASIEAFLAPLAKEGKIKPRPYLEMERGSLLSLVKKGHGHCTQIFTHYTKFQGLREWIKPRLAPEKLMELDDVFGRLSTADGDLFMQMTNIAQVLTNESRLILNLLLSGQTEVARKRLLEGRAILLPVEEKMTEAYAELQEVQQAIGSV